MKHPFHTIVAAPAVVAAGAAGADERTPNPEAETAGAAAEGWDRLFFLPGAGMFADDFEGMVDGCHPNDHGMVSLAKAYGAAVAEALGRGRRGEP